eukprot:3941399-Rhodomonas_salina.10
MSGTNKHQRYGMSVTTGPPGTLSYLPTRAMRYPVHTSSVRIVRYCPSVSCKKNISGTDPAHVTASVSRDYYAPNRRWLCAPWYQPMRISILLPTRSVVTVPTRISILLTTRSVVIVPTRISILLPTRSTKAYPYLDTSFSISTPMHTLYKTCAYLPTHPVRYTGYRRPKT